MKKILISIMFAVLFSLCALMTAAEDDRPITVNLNGHPIVFDVEPRLVNDRTMVPVRAIFEAIGADVEWDDATQTVIADKDDTQIKLTIGNNKLYKNGRAKRIDAPAMLVRLDDSGDRTLVPLRAVSEAFDVTVGWDDATYTVSLSMYVPAEKITLNKTSVSIMALEQTTLTATPAPEDAAGNTVKWTSSVPAVATVAEDGTVTALTAGSTVITAASDGAFAECLVEVTLPTLSFEGEGNAVIENIDLAKGAYYAEYVHAGDSSFVVNYYHDGKYERIANEYAETAGCCALYSLTRTVKGGMLEVIANGKWSVTFKPVEGTVTTKVSGTGSAVTGIFTATAETATAKVAHEGRTQFTVYLVRVKDNRHTRIVNRTGAYTGTASVRMDVGERYYFSVVADGIWTVDLGLGDELTQWPAYEAPAPRVAHVKYVDLTPTSLSMSVGEKVQMVAKVFPLDANQGISWSSSNPDVVKVSSNGKATAEKKGRATIFADSPDGIRAFCNVAVATTRLTRKGIQYDVPDLTGKNTDICLNSYKDNSGVPGDWIAAYHKRMVASDGNTVCCTQYDDKTKAFTLSVIRFADTEVRKCDIVWYPYSPQKDAEVTMQNYHYIAKASLVPQHHRSGASLSAALTNRLDSSAEEMPARGSDAYRELQKTWDAAFDDMFRAADSVFLEYYGFGITNIGFSAFLK